MKNFLLTVCLFLGVWGVTAPLKANSEVDSLKNLVRKSAVNDSIKAENALALAKSFFRIDYDSTVFYCNRAISIAQEANHPYVIGEAMRVIGITHVIRGANDLALAQFMKADQVFTENKVTRAKGSLSNNFATTYMAAGKFEEALERLEVAEKGMIERGDDVGLAIVRHNRGICNDELGRDEEALAIFKANIPAQEKNEDIYGLASTYNSVGTMLMQLERNEEAKEYLDKSRKIKRELNDIAGLSNLYSKYGELFHKQEKWDSSFWYFNEGIRMSRESEALTYEVNNLSLLAKAELAKGDFESSARHFAEFLVLNDSLTEINAEETSAGLQAAYELNNKNKEIGALQREQDLNNEEVARQRKYIFALGGGLLIFLVLLVSLVVSNRKNKELALNLERVSEEIKASNAQIATQNARLTEKNERLAQLHREQEGLMHMVVHDLKTPLNNMAALISLLPKLEPGSSQWNSVYDKIVKVNSDGTRLIEELLEVNNVENTAHMPPASEIHLESFFKELTEQFLPSANNKQIQLLYQPGKFHFQNALLVESYVTRIFENIVSNAIKFSQPKSEVRVEVTATETNLYFSVHDQGPGIPEEEQSRLFKMFAKLSNRPTAGESSTGLGLAAAKSLANKLGGSIGVDSKKGEGATFLVTLPLIR